MNNRIPMGSSARTVRQVELMIRDRERYRTTAGWGWGRWIGMDLKPDGQTLDFAVHTVSTVIMRLSETICIHNADKNQQRGCAVKTSRCCRGCTPDAHRMLAANARVRTR